MNRSTLLSFFGIVWILCLSLTAKGITPITITGPNTLCVGKSGVYSVSPTAGYHYQWTVTPEGNIIGSPALPTVSILWGVAGTATVTVNGYDSTNTLQEAGTLSVLVAPIPAPYITADKIAGCQNYADTPVKGRNEQGYTPGDPHILDDGNGCPKVCDSSVVTYTAYGPAGSTFGWTIAGGTIIGLTATTCTVYWDGGVGFGSVTVTDTSIYGCVGTKTICINIIERPVANFTTNNRICLNQPDIFLDLSSASPTSPIISWFWDFGDGSTFPSSSSSSVTHTYTTPGTKIVTLVVKNECGCTDTFTMKIEVMPQTGVTIVCPSVVCDSATATYSLSPAIPCSPYTWAVQGGNIVSGMGTPTITVQWTTVDSTGFGYVAFDPSGCHIPCTAPTIVKVPVITPHGYIAGPKIVCPYTQYLYSLPQWPTTTFTWSVLGGTGATLWPTDQNNQIALNTHDPGIIILQCTYMNTLLGCGGTAYDTITVVSPDSIIGATLVCYGSTGYYNLGSGATADWTLTYPDLSTYTSTTNLFNAPFNQVGHYSLNATGAFCLSRPLDINVDSLPPAPDSLLGPDTACFGSPVDFRAKNTLPGTIFSWAAATGTVHFPSGDHTTAIFSGGSPATIMVWRESMDAAHCHSDTLSKLVYRPYVNLNITGADTVCPSTEYSYDAGYYDGETYSWHIYSNLMGSVEIDGHPTSKILFNSVTGPAVIVVTVRKCDSTYTDSFNVYVRPLPSLSLTINPNPVCRDVPFTATLVNGNIGTIDWNWGDGTPDGSGAVATHAYHDLLGTNFNHTVVCTVTNPYGCAGVVFANTTVTELPAPVANLTPNGTFISCTPPSQNVSATLTTGFEPTDSLIWGSTAGGHIDSCMTPFPCNPLLVTSYGSYYVIAVGVNGCRDMSDYVNFDTCHPVSCTIAGSPYATIDFTSNNCGIVHLHGVYASFPTAFSWTWGWPSNMHTPTPTNTTLDGYFTEAGNYEFTYYVGFTDAAGDTCYVQGDTTLLVPFIAGMGHTITCAGSVYTVSLIDHSNYYPGHSPYQYSWYVDGSYVVTTTASSYTLNLPAGPHTFAEWAYYGPGTLDSCMATDAIQLDTVPHADFSFARDTTCAVQASVQFTNLSTPTSTAWTSAWDFGDGSGNTQTNPWKVFTPPLFGGVWLVNLTITNPYGCTSDTTIAVPVIPQDLSGTIVGDTIACAGQSVSLLYTPDVSTIYPENYYWMQNTDTMFMTVSPGINVYTSGSYWLTGINHYGCYVNTSRVNVLIINVPPAVINGDTSQCLNVPYTLNGYAGSDPSIGYTWIKDGVAVGSGPDYTDPAALAGSFTYQLVISVPNPEGGFCADTSAPFTVTVHAQPPAPSITYSMVDCNSYTIKLNASGPGYGFYNWSNSMFGQTINVPEGGGPYKVWYTDTFGCVSSGTTMVPRDPRLYLWVFPSGCFDFCKQSLPRTIIGPIEPFAYWGYLMDPSTIVSSGFNTAVGSYAITAPGDYQLILDNSLCRDTSDIMDVTVHSCQPCRNLRFQVQDVYETGCDEGDGTDATMTATAAAGTDATAPGDPCCHTFLVIAFNNVFGTPIGVSLTATNGSFAPGGALIPPGGSVETFEFIRDPGFVSGPIVVTITYTDPATGIEYTCSETVKIPPCNVDPAAPKHGSTSNAGSGNGNKITPADGTAAIKLVPNPAHNTTRVDYQFNGNTGGVIEIYDMMGRLIVSHTVTDNQGSWTMDLNDYVPGIYEVVLKQDGKTILQSKLSIAH